MVGPMIIPPVQSNDLVQPEEALAPRPPHHQSHLTSPSLPDAGGQTESLQGDSGPEDQTEPAEDTILGVTVDPILVSGLDVQVTNIEL